MPAESHVRRGAPGAVGSRLIVLGALGVAGIAAMLVLGVGPAGSNSRQGGLDLAAEFLGHALSPALTYESAVPEGTRPLLLKCADASLTTVRLAAAATLLSVLVGFLLSFPASSAWWEAHRAERERRWWHAVMAPIYTGVRGTLALMRSVHELLWAVLFLAAFGVSELAAVLAIAIPYAGTLAKIFAEMIDEAERDAAEALRRAGAQPWQVHVFGLLPRALPDLVTYTFYRFECALRSAAVLGFFGFPTLGYYLSAAFENLHYGETWTYLYCLFALVALADLWSGALRRRLIS